MNIKTVNAEKNAEKGKISAQPHTSSCIYIWGFIIQFITNKMCMHNEEWGCAEIFPWKVPWWNNEAHSFGSRTNSILPVSLFAPHICGP